MPDNDDELLEVTETARLSREAAADRLSALADSLRRHNSLEFKRDGLRYTVDVADEVELEVEIEIGGDGNELEIEIRW